MGLFLGANIYKVAPPILNNKTISGSSEIYIQNGGKIRLFGIVLHGSKYGIIQNILLV